MINHRIISLYIIILFTLVGCGNKEVSVVKEGTMDFDKSLTIGQAIDNYKYFKKVNWKLDKSDNGKKIVVVTGDIDIEKIIKEYRASGGQEKWANRDIGDLLSDVKSSTLEFDFLMNTDNTFELVWYGYRIETRNGDKYNPPANSISDKDELRFIYKNKYEFIAPSVVCRVPQPHASPAPAPTSEAPVRPSSSIPSPVPASSQNPIVTVSAKRAYFYTEPNGLRAKAFVIQGDVVTALESRDGFVHAKFISPKGAITIGWLKTSELSQQ